MTDTSGSAPATTKRQASLALAEDLLGDIELGRIGVVDIARKAGRLARLLDDVDASNWLQHESGGYPPNLDAAASVAAVRSHREASTPGSYWTTALGTLELDIRTMSAEIEALAGPLPAGDWAYRISLDRTNQRGELRTAVTHRKALLDTVLGQVHRYAADRYQELRFGAAVETAFEVVRVDVDARITRLIPEGLPMLTAAFENAVSDQPEHWANAASTCRRLLKLAADALRPAGPDKVVPGRKPILMGDGNYINRLVDWISTSAKSETAAAMIVSDLEYLGRRLDAADAAGQKGAHDQVDQFDASRFITGTYLILGDLLRLRP